MLGVLPSLSSPSHSPLGNVFGVGVQVQWRPLRADLQGAFPEAVSGLGLFSHYLYPCKCASQIPANTLGFVMLFNSLNHLNEIFMFPSLLEQSPRFPEISLSLVFKDSPTGGGSSLPEAWDTQGAALRGAVGVLLLGGGDWRTPVPGFSWGPGSPK